MFFFSLCIITAHAQTMSVESFTALPEDMDARVYFPKRDQNGRVAALIKVESVEKGFAFDVGSLGVVDVVHDKIAETWVYVPHGVIRITIQHPKLGTIRNYEFPIPISEASVYRLVLTSGRVLTIVEESDGGQFFILRTDAADATLSIDGGTASAITDGAANVFLDYGEHSYTVSAPLYQSVSGTVKIADERIDTTVVLQPNFGYFTLSSTPSARVELNGIEVGTTPYTSPRLTLGDYTVRLYSSGYETRTRTVSLTEPGETVVVEESLLNNSLRVSLYTPLSDANLTVNGEVKGQGSWQGYLLPGEYLVTATKEGYRESKKRVVIDRNSSLDITIDAPSPMYGKFRVNSSQIDVEVAIDGKVVGVAPDIFSEILVGNHTVTYTRNGYVTKTEQITVEEGKIAQASVSLTRGTDTPVATTPTPVATPQKPVKEKTPPAPKTPKEPKAPSSKSSDVLLLAQASYHPSQLSYGVMAGYLYGNNGFYLKYLSNFQSEMDAVAGCDYDGNWLYGNDIDSYSGNTHTARYTFTAGYMRRLSSMFSLYAGAGYGARTLQWETNTGEWVTNDDCSYTGVTLDAGCVVQFGSFALSIGCNSTAFSFNELTAGIGFAF